MVVDPVNVVWSGRMDVDEERASSANFLKENI